MTDPSVTEPAVEPRIGAAIRQAVRARELELVELVGALVRIPSPSGSEHSIQRFVADQLATSGLTVSSIRAGAADNGGERAANVLGTLRGAGGGRALLLCGHVDTVPVADPAAWTVPPFGGTIAGGRIWGRGACDMKAGVAAAITAVRALADCELVLRGDLAVLSTVEEEIGGLGAVGYAESLDPPGAPDAAIVMEPTSLVVAPAHAGGCYVSIAVDGKSAHAGSRTLGVSAIEKFAVVLEAIREFERARNDRVRAYESFSHLELPAPINVGTVNGGEWTGSVPELVTATARVGVLPGEDPARVRRDFQDAVLSACARDEWMRANPPRIDWTWSMPASSTPVTSPIVTVLRAAASAASGRPTALLGMPYGADMAHLTGIAAIPTAMFGAGDIAVAHQADEHVPIEDVLILTEALARCAHAWCA
jgi:acetylornithine deacetylase